MGGKGTQGQGGGDTRSVVKMGVGRGLWGKGCREGSVGKRSIHAWRGLWGKACGEGTCEEMDAWRGLSGKGRGQWGKG